MPLSTVDTLPETGVSSAAPPAARTRAAVRTAVSGSTVLVSQTTVPSATPAAMPSGPWYAASAAASSASETSTTGAEAAAARAVSATVAPIPAATASARERVRL